MNVLFKATDSDGVLLYSTVEEVTNWQEACRLGMDRRNQLVGNGVYVNWFKFRKH